MNWNNRPEGCGRLFIATFCSKPQNENGCNNQNHFFRGRNISAGLITEEFITPDFDDNIRYMTNCMSLYVMNSSVKIPALILQ